MRIISGDKRGTKLKTLKGVATRPTLDRVKESLFSIIQAYILDAYVLDLFGGSGALALESLSRGAKFAAICDNSRDSYNVIKENLLKIKLEDRVSLYNIDFRKCLEQLKNKNMAFDIIFIDPPYKTNLANIAIKHILELNLLNKNGILIVETDDNNIAFDDNIQVYDIRKYGRVNLIFLNRKG